MKYIDTHSHLYSNKFDQDLDQVIERAEGVLKAVFLPNIDRDSIPAMHQLSAMKPGFFFPMMGLHPTSVKEGFEAELEMMKTMLQDPNHVYYGIGETGLDLYWDQSTLDIQQASLRVQIQWAKEFGLPIILHARDAIDETIDMIASDHNDRLSGIFHCFDGTIEQAQRIMEFGNFKIGIGGIVTYRKDVQAVVQQIDPSYLVLETDSPYLPPEPHRKDKPRRNESSYTKYVGAKIAELLGREETEIADITNQNAINVFQLEALFAS